MYKKILFASVLLISLSAGKAKAQEAGGQDTLTLYRKQIDSLDKEIINLLGERMKAAKAIGVYKLAHKMEIVQSARFSEVLQNAIRYGNEQGLSADFIKALYNNVHEESVRQQRSLQPAGAKP
jgi:chorismate mutase